MRLTASESDIESDSKTAPRAQPHRRDFLWRVVPWLIHLALLSVSGVFLLDAVKIREQALGPAIAREYGG